jgi:uncharacterized membrane protein
MLGRRPEEKTSGHRGTPAPSGSDTLAAPPASPLPESLLRFLDRYPFFKRHPHPMVAHFTIVFMLSATFFNILYLLTGVQAFEATGFYCLGGGVLSTPVTNLTGHFSRWVNYPGDPSPTLMLEARLSWLLLAISLAAFIWRFLDPDVLRPLRGFSFLYLLLLMAVTPLVAVISYFGGMLTFPLEGTTKLTEEN